MKPKYWVIKWNAKVKKRESQKRSSRMFQTFLERSETFETYGYNSLTSIRQFAKVNKGDQVFCYQIDEQKLLGRCEVKAIESNAPGGLCLVLAKVPPLKLVGNKDLEAGLDSKLVEKLKKKGTIHELLDEDAKKLLELFERCGLELPGKWRHEPRIMPKLRGGSESDRCE